MKRVHVLALIAAGLLVVAILNFKFNYIPTPHDPASRVAVIDGTGRFGCSDESDYAAMISMLAQKDTKAWISAVYSGEKTGRVYRFIPNEKVFIEDVRVLSGRILVRPEGKPRAYWTSSKSIVAR